MYGINLLINEHENILKMRKVVRKICVSILDGAELNVFKFEKIIKFAKEYADEFHHFKEEAILFRVMIEKSNPNIVKIIKNEMLVEHDLGTLHLSQLSKALEYYKSEPKTECKMDIIFNILAYVELLKRHIKKEHSLIFDYANDNLPKEFKNIIDSEIKDFEEKSSKKGIQKEFLKLLGEIES